MVTPRDSTDTPQNQNPGKYTAHTGLLWIGEWVGVKRTAGVHICDTPELSSRTRNDGSGK